VDIEPVDLSDKDVSQLPAIWVSQGSREVVLGYQGLAELVHIQYSSVRVTPEVGMPITDTQWSFIRKNDLKYVTLLNLEVCYGITRKGTVVKVVGLPAYMVQIASIRSNPGTDARGKWNGFMTSVNNRRPASKAPIAFDQGIVTL
jgi:hypothetical protein